MGEPNNEVHEEQVQSENEIPDVHLRERISTNPQDLDGILALLSHTGQVHNEQNIMKAIERLTTRDQQEKYDPEVRRKIAAVLAQIVVFNQRKNPDFAVKVREALKTFIS